MILSKKDAALLEDTIVQYGRIVRFDQLQQVFKKGYSLAAMRNRVSLLAKIGWLIRIKKGLYGIVTDIGALSSNDISIYTLCQALNNDSYISFEQALHYHGMFDQMLSSIGAITFKRARTYTINNTQIQFFTIKKELYCGFSQQRSDIGCINIADKEKAILDILYFRSNAYYARLVWEKLHEYQHDFDFSRLKEYAKKFNFHVLRHIGFFLDRLLVDTKDLSEIIQRKTSYSMMTKNARQFDSKWRLYVDHSIIK